MPGDRLGEQSNGTAVVNDACGTCLSVSDTCGHAYAYRGWNPKPLGYLSAEKSVLAPKKSRANPAPPRAPLPVCFLFSHTAGRDVCAVSRGSFGDGGAVAGDLDGLVAARHRRDRCGVLRDDGDFDARDQVRHAPDRQRVGSVKAGQLLCHFVVSLTVLGWYK